MTDNEFMLSLQPQIELIRHAILDVPIEGVDIEEVDRQLMEITHQIYDVCRAIGDEQFARNQLKYQNHVQPKPKSVTPRPTLEDIL